jgi:uncharacterized protein YggU (UPF0235/DUF167 family)
MRIMIQVRPQTAGTRVGGSQDNALVVRVGAAPGDSRGTEIALRALAAAFGVRRTDVTLVGGATSALHLVNVGGGVEDDLLRRRDQLLAL